MKEVVALARAESHLVALYAKLEDSREGLGDRFDADYRAACIRLESFPEIGPRFVGRIRRLLLLKWSVALFYVVESDRVVIHAALDVRQSPEHIRRELGLI